MSQLGSPYGTRKCDMRRFRSKRVNVKVTSIQAASSIPYAKSMIYSSFYHEAKGPNVNGLILYSLLPMILPLDSVYSMHGCWVNNILLLVEHDFPFGSFKNPPPKNASFMLDDDSVVTFVYDVLKWKCMQLKACLHFLDINPNCAQNHYPFKIRRSAAGSNN